MTHHDDQTVDLGCTTVKPSADLGPRPQESCRALVTKLNELEDRLRAMEEDWASGHWGCQRENLVSRGIPKDREGPASPEDNMEDPQPKPRKSRAREAVGKRDPQKLSSHLDRDSRQRNPWGWKESGSPTQRRENHPGSTVEGPNIKQVQTLFLILKLCHIFLKNKFSHKRWYHK